MNNKYKIIAIIGQAGSGKDYFARQLLESNLIPNSNKIIITSTRPIREHEENNKDYHFVDIDTFTTKMLTGELIEATTFRNWYYGTSIDDLDKDKINIGVYNPEAVEILVESSNLDIFLVYVTASDKTRLLRQLNREEKPDCDEIVRRYTADQNDFRKSRIELLRPAVVVVNDGDRNVNDLVKEVANAYNYYTLGKND